MEGKRKKRKSFQNESNQHKHSKGTKNDAPNILKPPSIGL